MPFKYGNLEIGSFELADGSVTTAKLADDAVTVAKIVDAAITAAKLATDSVTEDAIAAGAVVEDAIADFAVAADKLAASAVETDKIATGAVTTAKIGNAQITNALIANLAVDTANIIAGAITTALIDDAAITTAKIDVGAITTALIDTAAITTAKIDAAAITTALIADLAVNSAKISDLVVSKLTGGALSVTEYLESEDYEDNPEDPIVGFHIDGDGTAVFTSVVVGSADYTINAEGEAAFATVSAESIALDGEDLAEILAALPKGIIARASYTTSDGSYTFANSGGEKAIVELSADLEDGRMYRIYTTTIALDPDGTPGNDRFAIRLRYTDNGTSPSTSSNILTRGAKSQQNAGLYSDQIDLDIVVSCDDSLSKSIRNLNSGEHRFLLCGESITGSVDIIATTGSGSYNPITLIIEDIGPLIEDTGVDQSGSGGGTTPETTYTKTYNATGSRAFRGDNSIHSTNGEIAQGDGGFGNGDMKSWVGFDQSQIQSDLSGATILKVEFYLYFFHWYFNAGGTAVIGTHSETNVTSNGYSSGKADSNLKQVGFNRNQGKWVDMTSVVGNDFKSGAATGIMIGPDPGTNQLEYYGKARGNTQSNEPKIRIKYKK